MIKWLLLTSLILVIAMACSLGFVVLIMYALLVAILFSRMLTQRWIGELEASRTCHQYSLTEGGSVAVAVEVKNSGRVPIIWCLIEDMLPRWAIRLPAPRVTPKTPSVRALSLKPGERETIFYQLQFNRRGYYPIGPLVMETGDLFGLFRRCRTVTRPHYVLVYPDVVTLEGWDIASRRPIGEVRMGHRLMEDPTRIAGVRRYEPGDPMNLVHWKTTARTGVLHTKQLEPSTVTGATLLVDFHRGAYRPENEPFRSELTITAAASVAHTLYQMGKPLGLVTNGHDLAAPHRGVSGLVEFNSREQAQQAVRETQQDDTFDSSGADSLCLTAGRGPEQFMRILELLSCIELSDRQTLSGAVMEHSGRIARDATVLAVLSVVSPETAITLGSLRRRGFAVSAIVNTYYEQDFEQAVRVLAAEGIEAVQLVDRDGVARICQHMSLNHR